MRNINIEYQPFKRIRYTKKESFTHPESWEELTPKQLIIGASILNGTISDDRVIQLMTEISKRVIKRLSPYQKFRIVELLKFLNDFTPYHEFIIPQLGDLKKPKPRLKDETFGTFIFAETYFLKYERTYEVKDLDRFIACFYRLGKFEESTLDANTAIVSKFPEVTKKAIYINYLLIRQYIAENYPYVFTQDEDVDEQTKKHSQSWLDVFDAIVKDDIVQQEKYADLPISQVLRYLNNQIKADRTNGKK